MLNHNNNNNNNNLLGTSQTAVKSQKWIMVMMMMMMMIIIIIIMPKSVCEEGDVTVLWNQLVHTDREVTTNRPDIIIKIKKRENMHTDRCGNT